MGEEVTAFVFDSTKLGESNFKGSEAANIEVRSAHRLRCLVFQLGEIDHMERRRMVFALSAPEFNQNHMELA